MMAMLAVDSAAGLPPAISQPSGSEKTIPHRTDPQCFLLPTQQHHRHLLPHQHPKTAYACAQTDYAAGTAAPAATHPQHVANPALTRSIKTH
ncbi:hypothetical protein J2X19_004055 [Rhodoferax ferrireducens]|uniref:Uncharacterized protein n=1 Tax=Rhodoferax ferrireducens TaxID=192843 RepID=A0ABU2CDK1_9BURK|nr:hypothetical protein [Rhodoferax ferrireducens]